MAQGLHFKTLDEFNRGYAGPQTLLLEKKCRELAGRQDNFCLICGDDAVELFPQLGPKEIHLCPRRFCKKCYYIQSNWKKSSKRFDDEIYQECEFVTQCCALCWKRGWDISNPLLGQDQPEWQGHPNAHKKDVLSRRHRHWEECAIDADYKACFKWRLPLITLPDDMTLESDRTLVERIKNDFLKKPPRFNRFSKTAMVEASPSGAIFNVAHAFDDIRRRLLNLVPPTVTYDEEEEAEMGPEEVSHGGREEREGPLDQQAVHQRRQAGRPQRQAAKLNFTAGRPLRQQMSTTDKPRSINSSSNSQDQLDQQVSGSMVAQSSTSQPSRSLRNHLPVQEILRRPRGRPRKVPRDPTELPPPPSMQEDDTTTRPSLITNDAANQTDPDHDESLDQVMVVISNKFEENRKLKEDKAHQEAQIRLLKEDLERSHAKTKALEHQSKTFSAKDTDHHNELSAAKAAVAELNQKFAQHEEQNAAAAELKRKITQQEEQIEDYVRKCASREADLEASKAQNAELNHDIAGLRVAHSQLQEMFEKRGERISGLKVENRVVFNGISRRDEEIEELNNGISRRDQEIEELKNGISRRDQEIEELKKATCSMDRQSNLIRTLRDGQDDILEVNKQQQKDIASLGAEIALKMGLQECDIARMQTELLRGGLNCELVSRLAQNGFLKDQMAEKMKERAMLAHESGDGQVSPTNPAKRRRKEQVAGNMEPTYRREDSEMYD